MTHMIATSGLQFRGPYVRIRIDDRTDPTIKSVAYTDTDYYSDIVQQISSKQGTPIALEDISEITLTTQTDLSDNQINDRGVTH